MSTHITSHEFHKGDKIQVLRNTVADDVISPSWFPATVIAPPSPSGKVRVKFNALFTETRGKMKRVREYVDVNTTRPAPAFEAHRLFVAGDEVVVFHENEWWKGNVKEVLEDCKYYKVVIGGGVEVVVENWKVRVRVRVSHDWNQDKSDSESKKVAKLRIICGRTFHEGAPVEVKSDEEGYHGSWYTATVVKSTSQSKLLVQYDTLVTDDEMHPLVEKAYASHVRPLPPMVNRFDRFKMLEEVDAWYNDGWWVGLVSKVLAGLKYVVYFWMTNEEFEFEHSKLRTHQELINGKWVASFLRPKLDAKSTLEKVKIRTDGRILKSGFLRGLKVEIAYGERGHSTTFYPAVILGPVRNRRQLVEYRTLKTDNGRELLKEDVDLLCVKPCLPITQRAQQFQPGDNVDAWDDNAWRSGQVRKSMNGSKYAIYFRATNSVAEFQHAYLRPRQYCTYT